MERHGWFGPTIERLVDIMRYPDTANEFACRKVTSTVVRMATMHLCRSMGENSQAPRIVPRPDGGLILEWLEYWVDMVVEIDPSGSAQVVLNGDPEFFKKHGRDFETAKAMFFDEGFVSGIDLLEVLRKEGPPKIPAPPERP
jgi:hypothetical protein